jgi:Lar family restriction alleviation protein
MSTDDFAIRFFRDVSATKAGMPPCPFCGSVDVEAQLQMDDIAWVVTCKACDAYGPYTENGGPVLAIKAWSRRTSTPKDWLSRKRRGLEDPPSVYGEGLEGLAPCPFCGHTDLAYEPGPSIDFISCRVCDTAGAVGNGSREIAISAWNRRS